MKVMTPIPPAGGRSVPFGAPPNPITHASGRTAFTDREAALRAHVVARAGEGGRAVDEGAVEVEQDRGRTRHAYDPGHAGLRQATR